jgi:hypothetical protein
MAFWRCHYPFSEACRPDAPFEQMFSTAGVRDCGGAGRLLDRQSRARACREVAGTQAAPGCMIVFIAARRRKATKDPVMIPATGWRAVS